MTWKKIAAAAALVVSITPVMAADQSVTINPLGVAAFVSTTPLLAGGDDIISFLGLSPGAYNFDFGLVSGSNISSVTVNGQVVPLISSGPLGKVFSLISFGSAPLSATIMGTAGLHGYYAGALHVTAVPEAESYAMMLAGLVGIAGFVHRRRRA